MALPALSPADSARVVAQVYSTSLLLLLPVAVAAIAALVVRHAPAATRVLVWRCAVGSLVGVLALRLVATTLTLPFIAWVVPSGLATPLVALGRAQMSTSHAAGVDGAPLPALLLVLYLVGVASLLWRLMAASRSLRTLARRAAPPSVEWQRTLDRARAAAGVRRHVRLLVSSEQQVPVTWGVVRPVILVPASATCWSAVQREAALVHELSHVRAWDALAQLLARLLCALLWFHPAAWWIAARLRAECELACDERVLAAGVRRSDYAELLAMAAEQLRGRGSFALAMAARAGLRARLAAVTGPDVRRRGPSPAHHVAAVAISALVAVPTGLAQLAPTRDVLDGLMRDVRWESRAYAVTRLAQRPDSVAVARQAATRDPSPRVRAWAARALASQPGAPALPLVPR